MQDTVGNEDVGHDDLGGVDEDGAILMVSDAKLFAVILTSECCAVCQRGRVVYAVDDVVLDDSPQIVSGEVSESRTNAVESLVVGREDGHVAIVGFFNLFGRIDGTSERGQVESKCCVENIGRECKHAVDDVNNTTGKIPVL